MDFVRFKIHETFNICCGIVLLFLITLPSCDINSSKKILMKLCA